MIFFFGNHMKVNQTFPKQMKDSDQEQSEDEAGALRVAVIQSSPRHGRASRFLPWKTGYCSLAAPGKPLSITPGRSDTKERLLWGLPGWRWQSCPAMPLCQPGGVVPKKDLRGREMFKLQGLHMVFLFQARAFLWGLNPGLQTS